MLRITRSASWRIRIRRSGASAMVSSASYSASDRSCSARSSSSRRRDDPRVRLQERAPRLEARVARATAVGAARSVTVMAAMLHLGSAGRLVDNATISGYGCSVNNRPLMRPTATRRNPDPMTTWKIDNAHTQINFSAKHMMVTTVRGKFHDVEGTIELDETDPTRSRGEFRVAAASVDTNFGARDTHLRSADFFDAEQYPDDHLRLDRGRARSATTSSRSPATSRSASHQAGRRSTSSSRASSRA